MSDGAPHTDRRPALIWAVLVVTLLAVIALGFVSWLGARRPAGKHGVTGPGGTLTSGPAGEAWKPESAGPAAGAAPLPVGDPAPDFRLTERRGRIVTRADLSGKVWIANFIFTTCGSVCPELTRKMAAIRDGLRSAGGEEVLSVSFSVDPVRDTPAVLTEYAKRFHAETPAWLFLTGDPEEMLRVVNQGFHVLMTDPAEGEPAHSDRFILVDAQGRVRTTHQGSEPKVVDTVVREALALKKEIRG